MPSFIVTTTASTSTFFVIAIVFNVINAHSSDDVMPQSCTKGEYFNEATEQCELCTECKYSYFASHKCTPYQDTVCKWCGTIDVKKNADYFMKCTNKLHRYPMHEEKFEKNSRAKVMDSMLIIAEKKTSDEIIDIEQLPDQQSLPPLPTDDDYDDQEYDENDIFDRAKLGLPASEEELIGKEILLRHDIPHQNDKYNDEKTIEESDFGPLSGNDLLRDDISKVHEDVEKDLEEDKVQPINVNEAAIGEENELSKEDDELLQTSDRINIVAIAFRDKESNDVLMKKDQSTSSYTTVCDTMGIYLYLASFVIILGLLLKRCCKTSGRVPTMDFTDDQCLMIQRCAHNIKKKGKGKEEAIYDNDIAYV